MAINFPDTPTVGDLHIVGNRSWVYTASGWQTNTSLGTTLPAYLPLAGGTMLSTLTTATPSAAIVPLRIPHGTAPTTPTDGDVWTTTAGLFSRVNGSTVGPMLGSGVPATLSTSSASPALTITQTGAGPALLVEDSASADTTPFTILADGSTIIGSTALVPGVGASQLTISQDVTTPSVVVNVSSTSTAGPMFQLTKSRGTTASPAVVNLNDQAGQLDFIARGVSSFATVARVSGFVDATPTGSAIVPGRLQIYTQDSAGTLQERMRLDQYGYLSGTGTSLGFWATASVSVLGSGWAIGNGVQNVQFCVVGKTAHYRGYVQFGSTTTYGTAPLGLSFSGFFGQWFDTWSNLNIVTSTSILPLNGSAYAYDSSALTAYSLTPFQGIGENLQFMSNSGASGAMVNISNTVPFTWANGDAVGFAFSLELK